MPGKIVAIVDDEPLMVDMLSTFLKMKGYQVHGVYSGQAGIEVVQAEKPDVLLLDLMLPDIDGFKVCQTLRSMPAFADLPIVIISARTDEASKAKAEQAGADVYITKPVRFPMLISELERLLANRSNPT